jgi:hypothetical protein
LVYDTLENETSRFNEAEVFDERMLMCFGKVLKVYYSTER